jgi:hypothetical protein
MKSNVCVGPEAVGGVVELGVGGGACSKATRPGL